MTDKQPPFEKQRKAPHDLQVSPFRCHRKNELSAQAEVEALVITVQEDSVSDETPFDVVKL